MQVPRDTWGTLSRPDMFGWKIIVSEDPTSVRYIYLYPPAPSTEIFNHAALSEGELEAFFDPNADPDQWLDFPLCSPREFADVVWDGNGLPEDDPRLAPSLPWWQRLKGGIRRLWKM